jgi:hypothetical protein
MLPALRTTLFLGGAAALALLSRPDGDTPLAARLRPPAPLGGPEALDGLEGYACAQCHAEIAAEWSRTMHAHSWVDEAYQEELKGRRKPEGCHGCHAPQPLLAAASLEKPEPRDASDRKLGISCESCHLAADGAQLGPTGAATPDHPTRKSDVMIGAGTNALCAACHSTTVGPVIGIAKDFFAAKQADKGLSCVGCHFAPLREVGDGAEERVVKSHEVQTPRDPAFLRLAFRLSARAEKDGARVEIANAAGHRVPGLIGREIEFEVRALDAAGKEVGRASETLTTSSYLPVDGSIEIRVAAKGAKLAVRGLHRDPRSGDEVGFLEEELAWPAK